MYSDALPSALVAGALLDGFGRARQFHIVGRLVVVAERCMRLMHFVYSYAFAPASVVAPLGTTALIANCFIAPLMLHERFRKKDVLGIAFSIAGAVTIVLSSKSENKSVCFLNLPTTIIG